MKQSPKEPKLNESQQNSMNFDDNYNEEECLQQNTKIQKLSIMGDFNQLCNKLNQPPVQQSPQPAENTLANYYAQLRQKNQSNPDLKKDSPSIITSSNTQKIINNQIIKQKINKPSPLQSHVRSSSSNVSHTQQQNNSLQVIKHQRNPSQGQAFKKKIIQQMEINDSKRNYSSVEDKKKILQPSKNSINVQQNLSIKDYYGEQKSPILKKQTFKKTIPKDLKPSKETILHSYTQQTKQQNSQKFNKQNNLKESNVINQSKKLQTTETQKSSKVTIQKDSLKQNRPQIILFSKRINLSEDPQKLRAMLKDEQMRNDYDMSNVSISSIDEGLFGNAIEKQRNAKTTQTVQSPLMQINLLPPSRKEQITNHPKQYISSPINISHSPNPTNAPKSLFQKRQIYRA